MGLEITCIFISFVSPQTYWTLIFLQRDQDLAHSLSSRLNEAYQCLLHPLPRAEYILEKNGLQTNETDQVEDMEFMANIMDAREVIDDAMPENRGEVEALIESNQRMFLLTLSQCRLIPLSQKTSREPLAS